METDRDFGRARNREDVLALCKQPGERNLTSSRTAPVCDLLQPISELQYVREVFIRVSIVLVSGSQQKQGQNLPRNDAAEVIRCEILNGFLMFAFSGRMYGNEREYARIFP